MRVASAREEGAVVRHEQQRAGELPQGVFQPSDRVDVEMVRRLVEEEQIGFGDERLAEQRAAAPTARQLTERTVGWQRQARHDGLDTLLEPPPVAFLELVLELAKPSKPLIRFRHLHRRLVVLRNERAELPQPRGHFFEHRSIRGARDILIEARHPEPRGSPDRSAVRRYVARDHLEEARLARSVATDETDSLTRLDPEARVLEEGQVAK